MKCIDCEECICIGDGDFFCGRTNEIVAEDYEFYGPDGGECPDDPAEKNVNILRTTQIEYMGKDRVRVGSIIYGRERTCSFPVVLDEEEEERRSHLGPGMFVTQDVPLCCKCTSCGLQLQPYAVFPRWIRFCPSCGAKVVDAE